MKSRLPCKNRMSKKEIKATNEYLKIERESTMRRFFKLMCYTLNREYGFGAGRLQVVISSVENLCEEHEIDPIFWQHLDRVVIDELKIKFQRETDL